jgi:hypothetical protein
MNGAARTKIEGGAEGMGGGVRSYGLPKFWVQ